MDSEAPTGGKRRWRWLIPCLLGLPAGILLLGNLSLSSPWACRWIASKIERRTGMETRVGGASWSPWNGAAIDAVELLQPAPLRAALKEFYCQEARADLGAHGQQVVEALVELLQQAREGRAALRRGGHAGAR